VSRGVTLVLPAVLLVLAALLLRRELRLYRRSAAIGNDLFVYSRWRLLRRLGGIAALVLMAVTFVALGVLPPRSATGASAYLGAILGELAVLVVVPIWDLVETARTARPGRGERYR
jgi:hypothetical protein